MESSVGGHASEYLASVQDVVYEGSLPYFGLLATALTIGHKLNITGSTYPTGWDSFAIPILAIDLEYRERSGATHYLTTVTFSNRRAPFSGTALQRPAVLGQPLGIGLTELRAGPQPTLPSAADQWSPAAGALDQQGAMGSIRGDSPAPAAAPADDPAPSEALAGSLPDGSQAIPTDSPALSGGAAPSPQTGLGDDPADDEGQQGRRVRFAEGTTPHFNRKPPSFRPRVADTFARSHSRPDVDEATTDGDTATPLPGADGAGDAGSAAGAPDRAAPRPGATQRETMSRTEDRPDKAVRQTGNKFRASDQPDGVAHSPLPSRRDSVAVRAPKAGAPLPSLPRDVAPFPLDDDPGSPGIRQPSRASRTSPGTEGTNGYHDSDYDPTNEVDPGGPGEGYLARVGQVVRGYGDAVGGTARSLAFMARHPIHTARGIGTAIRHSILTGQAIGQMIREKSGTLRGQGELVGDALIGVATGGAIKAASKTAIVARIASRLKRVAGAAGADAAAGPAEAAAAEAGAVNKGPVRKITGDVSEQAGKQSAQEAAQQAGKETAQQAAKEIAEETGEQAGKAATPLARENRANKLSEKMIGVHGPSGVGVHTPGKVSPGVGVHARTGGVALDDGLSASASSVRNRVVLKDRIVAPGQWKDGNILLSRSAIREVAEETGVSVRRVLYDTAYHERFHGAIEPIAKRISRWLGVDDIYEASQVRMLYGQGRGWWYRAEEGGAEFHGRLRGFLRDRRGWK